jgi:hypothetical protein
LFSAFIQQTVITAEQWQGKNMTVILEHEGKQLLQGDKSSDQTGVPDQHRSGHGNSKEGQKYKRWLTESINK